MAEDGRIKGFFKNIGKKIDEATLESNIRSKFNSNNPSFGVFSGAKTFDCTSYGFHAEDHLADGYIIAFTNDEFDDKFLLEIDSNNKVYYIASIEEAKVSVEYNDTFYERDAKKIVLGEEAKKVDVIKVGDNYYLKK